MGLKEGRLFLYDKIYFDLDRNWSLEFVGLRVTDEEVFRKALKIPKKLWSNLDYGFRKERGRTVLFFEDKDGSLAIGKAVTEAMQIFDSWVEMALRGLKEDYNYRISDEAVIEMIEANEFYFLKDGRIFRP